jgi:hypothetical protein
MQMLAYGVQRGTVNIAPVHSSLLLKIFPEHFWKKSLAQQGKKPYHIQNMARKQAFEKGCFTIT